MGTRVWAVCENWRHIIVPLKSRDSNYPMRTETFTAHFEPDILRLVALLDLRSPKNMETLVWCLRLINRRRPPTVIADRGRPADRYRSYGNQA